MFEHVLPKTKGGEKRYIYLKHYPETTKFSIPVASTLDPPPSGLKPKTRRRCGRMGKPPRAAGSSPRGIGPHKRGRLPARALRVAPFGSGS